LPKKSVTEHPFVFLVAPQRGINTPKGHKSLANMVPPATPAQGKMKIIMLLVKYKEERLMKNCKMRMVFFTYTGKSRWKLVWSSY
jgi:hypothetical protein